MDKEFPDQGAEHDDQIPGRAGLGQLSTVMNEPQFLFRRQVMTGWTRPWPG